MSAKSKKNASLVDTILGNLIGNNRTINLRGELLRKWQEKCQLDGVTLTETKMQKAFKNLEVTVLKVLPCADEFLCDMNWQLEFA